MPNLIISIAFLALAGLTLVQTRGFPEYDYSVINSASFPSAIAVLMIVFAVLLVIRDLRRKGKDKAETAVGSPLNRYGLAGFAATAAYIALVDALGFLIPTTAALVFYSVILGRWKFRLLDGLVIPSIGVAAVVAMYTFLNVPLFKGLG